MFPTKTQSPLSFSLWTLCLCGKYIVFRVSKKNKLFDYLYRFAI